jgi:hypothetical protein
MAKGGNGGGVGSGVELASGLAETLGGSGVSVSHATWAAAAPVGHVVRHARHVRWPTLVEAGS